MKVARSTMANVPARVVKTLTRMVKWHIRRGYYDKSLAGKSFKLAFGDSIVLSNRSFVVFVDDEGGGRNGNFSVTVFNREGLLVDDRVYRRPKARKGKVPRKTLIGTPIVNGSRPMKLRPLRKKDPAFRL